MKTIILLISFFYVFQAQAENPRRLAANIFIGQQRGTGFFLTVNNQSYLITNAHVCIGKELYGKLANGLPYKMKNKFEYIVNDRKKITDSSNLIIDTSSDICLIPSKKGGKFKLVDGSIGDEVHYYTFDARQRSLKKKGSIVSSPVYDLKVSAEGSNLKHNQKMTVIISADTRSGDSGSLVFNSNKEVVGLVFGSATISNSDKNWGLMVPSSQILKTIKASNMLRSLLISKIY